jgi:DHA2 family multidrug resistance protein
MSRNTEGRTLEYTPVARWIILFALMLGTILETLDVSIVNVALPSMMGNLGATLDQVSWVSTGYIIANVIILPLSGWLSAYLGRRDYLAGSIALFTIASFMCGMSHSLNTLVFWRIVQGAGGAALLSTAMAALLQIFPKKQEGMVAAIFGIGVMIGPTAGPTLGGWITDNYSWPWIFFINIPIGVPAALLTLIFMHRSIDPEARSAKVDLVGIGLLAVGVGCLQVVLERGHREDWFQSAMIQWLSVVSAIGLLLFVAWELRTPNPAVNLRVLRHRSLTAGTLFSVVLGFGVYGSLFILPVYLQNVRGYSAMQVGIMAIPDGLASAVSMAIVGAIAARFAARNIVAVGALCFAAAMYLLSKVTLDTGPEHLLPAYILRGASLGLLFVPLSLASLSGLQGQEMADGSGLFNLMRQWGGSAGIAFLSTFLDQRCALHRAALVEHITLYSPMAAAQMHQAQALLASRVVSPAMVRSLVYALIDRSVQAQAYVLAFEDAFRVTGLAFVVALPLLLLFSRKRSSGGSVVGIH